MAQQIGRCEKHGMPIYQRDDGEIVHTCAHCAPPPDPNSDMVRLTGYKKTYHDEYCTDETLELMQILPCRISFMVPPWADDEFFSDYAELTGDAAADFDTVGISRNNAKTVQDKRWYSAKIAFQEDEDLVFSDRYTDRIKPCRKDGWVKIYCVHLAGFLLANGLKAGPNNCD